jgi:hypothetical protein
MFQSESLSFGEKDCKAIEVAHDWIEKFQMEEAESQSKVLAVKITKSQKIVVTLRNEYNKLLDEVNEVEMQLMESKLVT